MRRNKYTNELLPNLMVNLLIFLYNINYKHTLIFEMFIYYFVSKIDTMHTIIKIQIFKIIIDIK